VNSTFEYDTPPSDGSSPLLEVIEDVLKLIVSRLPTEDLRSFVLSHKTFQPFVQHSLQMRMVQWVTDNLTMCPPRDLPLGASLELLNVALQHLDEITSNEELDSLWSIEGELALPLQKWLTQGSNPTHFSAWQGAAWLCNESLLETMWRHFSKEQQEEARAQLIELDRDGNGHGSSLYRGLCWQKHQLRMTTGPFSQLSPQDKADWRKRLDTHIQRFYHVRAWLSKRKQSFFERISQKHNALHWVFETKQYPYSRPLRTSLRQKLKDGFSLVIFNEGRYVAGSALWLSYPFLLTGGWFALLTFGCAELVDFLCTVKEVTKDIPIVSDALTLLTCVVASVATISATVTAIIAAAYMVIPVLIILIVHAVALLVGEDLHEAADALWTAKLGAPLSNVEWDNEDEHVIIDEAVQTQVKDTTLLLLGVFFNQTGTVQTIKINLNNPSEVKGLHAWSALNIGNITSLLEKQGQYLLFQYDRDGEAEAVKLMPRASVSVKAG